MLPTSARVLRLLALLQARRFWPGAELAERLEVTDRTLRRDIGRLRSLGYPVNAASGVAGGYQLAPGAVMPPLLLEDDEALAVSLGLRTAAAGAVAGMEEAALRALTKLEHVLPTRLRARVKALHAAIVPMHLAAPEVNAEVLSALATACRDHEVVQFQYDDRQAQSSHRTVEPHGLVNSGSRWYFVAWDQTRGDWRTFRADRVKEVVVSESRFIPRPLPDGDLAKYVSRSISTDVYKYQARVILHAPLAQIERWVSPLAMRLESMDDTRCLLETGSHDLATLGIYIAHLGVEFEVVDPPELLQHLQAVADRLHRAAARAVTSR